MVDGLEIDQVHDPSGVMSRMVTSSESWRYSLLLIPSEA